MHTNTDTVPVPRHRRRPRCLCCAGRAEVRYGPDGQGLCRYHDALLASQGHLRIAAGVEIVLTERGAA